MSTIKELLHDAANLPQTADAALILAHVLNKDRSWLYAWPEHSLAPDQINQYEQLLQRRLQGEPLAYLTGCKEFWSLSLKVSQDTLIPRPETELLVETALELPLRDDKIHALDLGTGSGAIALVLASERPQWQLSATDISPKALQVAKENARTHGLQQIQFFLSHWFETLDTTQPFDLIVSNPPYVAEGDPHLQQDGLPHEPITALTAGDDGLNDLRTIIQHAPHYLQPQGWLIVEHGVDQGVAVQTLFRQAGFEQVSTRQDLERRDRISLGCYPRP